MTEGVMNQDSANPEKIKPQEGPSDKELNFRKLEAAREADREARIRAEMQAETLRNELQEIKQMLQPKEIDPLDGVEDYVDAERLKAKLEKESARLKKEAKEIARETVREEREQEEKKNYMQRLRYQFSDFDQVMTEENLAWLEQEDPVFIKTVLKVPDDYERRLDTYEKLKRMKSTQKAKEEPSIKEKVEENARNPYYIQPSVATPAVSAIDFDVRSKAARNQAYEKLKAAQRKPIGNVPVS